MPANYRKIKRLRMKREWTLQEAAGKAGFKSRQAWENIESGRQGPSLEAIERIAKALGVKVGELLKG